jgi:biotin operon repressor
MPLWPLDARGSRLSQHDLAYLVGATRENVNKCLQEWRRLAISAPEDRARGRRGSRVADCRPRAGADWHGSAHGAR